MAEFWTAALALTIFLYVLLDGIDLGVGILFGFERDEDRRRQMLQTVSPIWDGNETWLVVSAAILFAAFPLVYSLVLSAFYLPLMLLLAGLILRGVAFEFRAQSHRTRGLWDIGFWVGSIVAAFVQGCAVGALVVGLPNHGGQFTGGAFFWLNPFAVTSGIALCLGHALLAACWLVRKTEGALRDRARAQALWLLPAVAAALALLLFYSLSLDLPVLHRWSARPEMAVLPAIGLAGGAVLVFGLQRRRDSLPMIGGLIIYVAAFASLAASFLPYMIPFSITYLQAAAPASSLSFMFWFAGIIVLPLTIVYAAVNFLTFWGKIVPEDEGY
ncbi:cytochrome d ubiquinol oxidase subunit II [Sphingomonas sp. M1-B02]|uniref:cytochrome d ubiquinol oxidase subunit II n=1 Tax=Sphingomonas sp. M1-B02 TaxID=3114300 RepID=UPI00223EFE76|nr:cytochrome d ubiquinol oxidase subunit II [Sphingomonas sp. S6-11]UZK66315.1 cytochrome d ubiquinol oxidase subunit II [Sphingomonas sp. S6-11]